MRLQSRTWVLEAKGVVMPLLYRSHYQPPRGGHAPDDVREAFREAIDAVLEWQEGHPAPSVELRERHVPVSAICGLLWNCSDTLPGFTELELNRLAPDGQEHFETYAVGARALKSWLPGSLVSPPKHRPSRPRR